MPNDAKLGLIVGVGVVLAVAVVFFRKDTLELPTVESTATAASVGPANAAPPPSTPGRTIKGRATGQTQETDRTGSPASRRHVVQEGETLFSLAELYYGDKEKSLAIYQANQEVLKTPERLTPGTLLLIPNPTTPQPLPTEAQEKSLEPAKE
jgi:nucleoid-associated protein YgaU